MWKCLESGRLRQQIDMSRMRVQSEINQGKRLVVGVNAFQGEECPLNREIENCACRVHSKKLRLHTPLQASRD